MPFPVCKKKIFGEKMDHKVSPPDRPQEGFHKMLGGVVGEFEFMIYISLETAERTFLEKIELTIYIFPKSHVDHKLRFLGGGGEPCEFMIYMSLWLSKAKAFFVFFVNLLFCLFLLCFGGFGSVWVLEGLG